MGCVFVPVDDGVDCDDNDACTPDDVCSGGFCGGGGEPDGGGTVDCDDFNPCTADLCDPAVGCTHDPIDGQTCDDGDACTENDFCLDGGCTGDVVDCDDGDPCTTDLCDPAVGCFYKPVTPCCGNGVVEPPFEQCDPPDGIICDDACQLIGGVCGSPTAGDCCNANGSPGCDSLLCCEIVCSFLPQCCDSNWSDVCASQAFKVPECNCGGVSDCCFPHPHPGCDDPQCTAIVCQVDPLCCDLQWDQICVDRALQLCDICP